MPFDRDTWIQKYLNNLKSLFDSRLFFVGLQGSYGREEATCQSDIDMVAILDKVTPEDLQAYSTMLDTLSNREKICGFISGQQQLTNWERSDLFQFYFDTTPIYGSIDFIMPLIKKEDIHRAILLGDCNIYHMCGHNMVHERDHEILKNLYKTATFTVKAIYYEQTKNYIKQKNELIAELDLQEKEILQTEKLLKESSGLSQSEFEKFSGILFNWSSGLITKYAV